ncbi:MAG TPA: VOC family protein [Paracoccus sp. (in: a-proteobacteria)]|uniref:VOC family protein n=1 Tax=uncultured Paracoccus sp. TaxID=189685 RepID=UPI00260B14B3|nr:VOC family protein [uncultured Paracoccus sp.]HMQ39973.1 VOC family protein [Paracoccus sp. (in: a-proteobacteria)]HMR37288.1 VOC family protein [Paracoccus sp. (in: a-proteobacteria)]
MQIDYIEFSSPKIEDTKTFFADAFGWSFNDYGPEYQELADAGISGGIAAGPLAPPLVILKTDDLEAAFAKVSAAGARITREIYAFPGGRRFEFLEPGGSAMAVWSET